MRSGVPLTDEDRAPWLARVAAAATASLERCGKGVARCEGFGGDGLAALAAALSAHCGSRLAADACRAWLLFAVARPAGAPPQVVLACSALRKRYRNVLRGSIPARVLFLLLNVDPAALQGARAALLAARALA